jgi:hypothetical protein
MAWRIRARRWSHQLNSFLLLEASGMIERPLATQYLASRRQVDPTDPSEAVILLKPPPPDNLGRCGEVTRFCTLAPLLSFLVNIPSSSTRAKELETPFFLDKAWIL